MTYARARLLIGISGVGAVVTLATAVLVLGWPQALLPAAGGGLAGDALAPGAVLLVHALVLAPFDALGGHVLPRRFGRTDAPRVGPWHAARRALYLSWAGLGLPSRAVHCHAGRPELWALPPCD